MNDAPVSFAESDAPVRWLGLARHRLVTLGAVLALVADAVLRPGATRAEFVLAAALVLALPGTSTTSWGELAVRHLRYLLRRRVHWVTVSVVERRLQLRAGVTRHVSCYDFDHRGRLDLSGDDLAVARRLAAMADAVALSGEGAHVSVHVEPGPRGPVTTLCTTAASAPPPQWRPHVTGAGAGSLAVGRRALLERRTYLRQDQGLCRVARVEGFAPGRETAAIESLSGAGDWISMSLHADVFAATRSRRLSARAVHRAGADGSVLRAAGFRASARRDVEFDELRRREQSVARGAALCRWALYVVVHAASLASLEQRSHELDARARAAGLRLDGGVGRQWDWYRYQLPGGLGW